MMWMMMVAACSLVALMLEDDSAVKMAKLTKTGHDKVGHKKN